MGDIDFKNVILSALHDVNAYSQEHQLGNSEDIKKVRMILELLIRDFNDNGFNISENLLRACHDLGMMSYRIYENTTVEKSLEKVTHVLYENIDSYKNLAPLRGGVTKCFQILGMVNWTLMGLGL